MSTRRNARNLRTHDSGRSGASTIAIAGVTLLADLSGALYWEEERLLVVSDLHLEKGSSFAVRGILLPPFDTAATLAGSPPWSRTTIRAP